MPKVSVLMPVFHTNLIFLEEAVYSVLNQTFNDFEFIVVDDDPEDDREFFFKSISDSRIIYIKNQKNLGISQTRNKLINLARGEYLAIFDHDDVCLLNRLEKQVKFLDQNPSFGVVSSQVINILGNKTTNYPEKNLEIKEELVKGCCIPHTATMIRSSVLKKFDIRYEEFFSPCEDYMLFLKLLPNTMFYCFKEPLVKYRNFEGNTSHLSKEQMLDKSLLCKNFAFNNYSYLYNKSELSRKYWVYLFGIFPIMKVRKKYRKKIYFLFGFIPIILTRATD